MYTYCNHVSHKSAESDSHLFHLFHRVMRLRVNDHASQSQILTSPLYLARQSRSSPVSPAPVPSVPSSPLSCAPSPISPAPVTYVTIQSLQSLISPVSSAPVPSFPLLSLVSSPVSPDPVPSVPLQSRLSCSCPVSPGPVLSVPAQSRQSRPSPVSPAPVQCQRHVSVPFSPFSPALDPSVPLLFRQSCLHLVSTSPILSVPPQSCILSVLCSWSSRVAIVGSRKDPPCATDAGERPPTVCTAPQQYSVVRHSIGS